MRVLFLMISLIFLAAPAVKAAPTHTGSGRILLKLLEDTRNLGEQFQNSSLITAAYTTESKALVAKAANDLRDEIERIGAERALAPEAAGEASSLLGLSVYWGLTEILDVLLDYPIAKAQLEMPFGESHLWSYAAIGGAQAVRVCGDTHLDVGALVFPGYYGSDPRHSPFIAVRRKLEQAGAVSRPEEARQLWLDRCNPRKPITLTGPNGVTHTLTPEGPTEYIPGARDRVANAPDILEAILAEIQSQVTPQGLPMPKY